MKRELIGGMFIASLAACSSTNLQTDPNPDPVVAINDRPQCAQYCEVHPIPCEADTVPVVYGLDAPLEPDSTRLSGDNPNANFNVILGCVDSGFENAFVLSCPECRSAFKGSGPPTDGLMRSAGSFASAHEHPNR